MPAACSAATACAELGRARRGEARIGCEQRDRVVAPVVRQAEPREVALVDPGGHGHQLDGGDAQPDEVLDRRRVRERRAGAPQRLRHLGVRPREAAHVQLVDDGGGPRNARPDVGGGRQRLHRDGTGHRRRAVDAAARAVGAAGALDRVERERAVEGTGIGVDQQLGRIEHVAAGGVPGAVDAQPVASAGADPADEAVEDVAGALRQADAFRLGRAGRVEQAKLHAVGVHGGHGDVGAAGRRRARSTCEIARRIAALLTRSLLA